MSLYPILWAVEHAPIVDAEERAILVALVTKGDFDGCNCYRSFATLARVARVDRRTAMRKVQAMTDRGILREQKDPPPQSWYDLPADKRPVVREAMIPASFWSKVQLAEINESRADRGRAPINAENRPDLAEAPPKKTRADKGVPNPKRSKKKNTAGERGVSKTPAPESSGVSNSHLAGGLEDTPRGVSESPNPLIGPSDVPSSSSPGATGTSEAEGGAGATPEEEETLRKNNKPQTPPDQQADRELKAASIVASRLADTPDGAPTPEEIPDVLEYIRDQAAKNNTNIFAIDTWVTGRPLGTLRRDLAAVRSRRRADVPSARGGASSRRSTTCTIHTGEDLPCLSCKGDLSGGGEEAQAVIDLYMSDPDARPDLKNNRYILRALEAA